MVGGAVAVAVVVVVVVVVAVGVVVVVAVAVGGAVAVAVGVVVVVAVGVVVAVAVAVGGAMSNPTVCAVMLYADRPQFVRMALKSFRSQTYVEKRLLIFDSGVHPWDFATDVDNERVVRDQSRRRTIGILRNEANAETWSDIIVHADVDDWSHPRRIEEQVALLQASGKACVGYSDMLFWKADASIPWETVHCHCGKQYARSGAPCSGCGEYPEGEAWLYTGKPGYCLGTSLCYWREAWEKRPFEDLPKGPTGMGEDAAWIAGVDHLGVRSISPDIVQQRLPAGSEHGEPRMIASVHGGNTSHMAGLAIKVGDRMMKRVPEWDAYARERMAL